MISFGNCLLRRRKSARYNVCRHYTTSPQRFLYLFFMGAASRFIWLLITAAYNAAHVWAVTLFGVYVFFTYTFISWPPWKHNHHLLYISEGVPFSMSVPLTVSLRAIFTIGDRSTNSCNSVLLISCPLNLIQSHTSTACSLLL